MLCWELAGEGRLGPGGPSHPKSRLASPPSAGPSGTALEGGGGERRLPWGWEPLISVSGWPVDRYVRHYVSSSEPPVPVPPFPPWRGTDDSGSPLPTPLRCVAPNSLFRRCPAGHLSLGAVRAQRPLRVCLGLGDPLSPPLCPCAMPSSILAPGKAREPPGSSRGGLFTPFVSVCRWL